MRLVVCLAIAVAIAATQPSAVLAKEVRIGQRTFTIPDEFELELAAGPPLVDRPISAAFDEQGRLYVTESSGTNDKVQKQLEDLPHRVLRLEDTDGDGRYDRRTIFADRMMFPEGAMWLDGSLYVAAPPSIWKLTDTDGDGVADQREEWFQGKTLTGCANDLHGPYHGPDGWIYWCKGAFAEQTYERESGDRLVTKAAHVFRRRPEGGPIEHVMTGGMDNPVELVFTPGGERIFNTTFFQHPAGGQRDGLIHAIYGGVYGKPHYVLDGHPRTGDLMPVLTHLGAAAPSALERIESTHLGDEYQYNLLCCLFNMQKVTRHVLVPEGASYRTVDTDLIVSDDRDFHPTDVLEDADGSIVVLDTGGWYKLCCPTSQLWKPDVLGGIYRLRRADAKVPNDPRGLSIAWDKLTAEQLSQLLRDDRHAVRTRAANQLAKLGEGSVDALTSLLKGLNAGDERENATARRLTVWTMGRIGSADALAAVRTALQDEDEQVRQAAIHSMSVVKDRGSVNELISLLESPAAFNRRAAAEALGRIGDPAAVGPLLRAVGFSNDRALEHSLMYALIEIADAPAIRTAAKDASPAARRTAMMALSQMTNSPLEQADVLALLQSPDELLRMTGYWIVQNARSDKQMLNPEVGQVVVARYFDDDISDAERQAVEPLLAASSTQLESAIAASLGNKQLPADRKVDLLELLGGNPPAQLPTSWQQGVAELLGDSGSSDCQRLLLTLRRLAQKEKDLDPSLKHELQQLASNEAQSGPIRLSALACLPRGLALTPEQFELAEQHIVASALVEHREAAREVVSKAQLTPAQAQRLANRVAEVGPLEIEQIVRTLSATRNAQVAESLLRNLVGAPAVLSIERDKLRKSLDLFGSDFRPKVEDLCQSLDKALEARSQGLSELLEQLPEGDIRRGQEVFNSAKASCSACHSFGYLGGKIGPDLTRIGGIRSRRDLLEAIVFPSASFVRSYEPVVVLCADGTVVTGVLKEDSDERVLLVTTDRKEIAIPRDEVEQQKPGTVSIMPAGLDKQLSQQELADLISFLEAAK